MVPDLSLRKMTAMGVDGRLRPELMAFSAGSSHLVMVPLKIFAAVGPSNFSPVSPVRWYVTAIGPNTVGRSQAGEPHRCAARSF